MLRSSHVFFETAWTHASDLVLVGEDRPSQHRGDLLRTGNINIDRRYMCIIISELI